MHLASGDPANLTFARLLVGILVLFTNAVHPALAADCAALRITDFGNTTLTKGCELFLRPIHRYARGGSYTFTTVADGGVLTCEWGAEHVLMHVALNGSVRMWSGCHQERGDVTGTTLRKARYTNIKSAVSDGTLVYVVDDGKLKKADTLADHVTHVAGDGTTAASSWTLVQRLGTALTTPLGGLFQAFAAKSGLVYLALRVGNEVPGIILRFDPTTATVTLAVPFQFGIGPFPPTAEYGAAMSIFASPISADGSGGEDIMIQSRCVSSPCDGGNFRVIRYSVATNTFAMNSSSDAFAPGMPERFGSDGGVGVLTNNTVIPYTNHGWGRPANTAHRLLFYNVEANIGSLESGIGTSSGGVEVTGPMRAGDAMIGLVYGLASTADGRHLFFSNRGAKEQHLLLVSWRNSSETLPTTDPAAPVPIRVCERETPVPTTTVPQTPAPTPVPEPPQTTAVPQTPAPTPVPEPVTTPTPPQTPVPLPATPMPTPPPAPIVNPVPVATLVSEPPLTPVPNAIPTPTTLEPQQPTQEPEMHDQNPSSAPVPPLSTASAATTPPLPSNDASPTNVSRPPGLAGSTSNASNITDVVVPQEHANATGLSASANVSVTPSVATPPSSDAKDDDDDEEEEEEGGENKVSGASKTVDGGDTMNGISTPAVIGIFVILGLLVLLGVGIAAAQFYKVHLLRRSRNEPTMGTVVHPGPHFNNPFAVPVQPLPAAVPVQPLPAAVPVQPPPVAPAGYRTAGTG